MYKKYNFSSIAVAKSQGVEISAQCNSITFINTGTGLVFVNRIPLNPGVPGTNNGESFSIPGNYGEVFDGRVDISFPVAAATNEVLVIQKTYFPE